MDYHRNSGNSVVARLFGSEHKPKLPTNRWLDPHSDRYRCHTHYLASPWGNVNTILFR